MKNIANYISISRIIVSILLIIIKTFSVSFNILYIYCGISDMLDGYIARKTASISDIGNKLDSVSDLMFVIISIIKIVPFINLHNGIIIWIICISLIKIYTLIYSYIYYKKIIFLHTIANKITGFILFISPLILYKNNILLIEIIICGIATFSAVQEYYYIKNNFMEDG